MVYLAPIAAWIRRLQRWTRGAHRVILSASRLSVKMDWVTDVHWEGNWQR